MRRFITASLLAFCSCAPNWHYENKYDRNANWDKDWYECDKEVKSREHRAASGGIAGALGVASQMISEQESCMAARGWKKVPNEPKSTPPTQLQPAPVAPAAPTFVAVTLRSTPDAAEVYVDTQFIGTTPINQYKLDIGTHAIEVRKSGYAPWNRQLTIQAGTPVEVVAELQAQP